MLLLLFFLFLFHSQHPVCPSLWPEVVEKNIWVDSKEYFKHPPEKAVFKWKDKDGDTWIWIMASTSLGSPGQVVIGKKVATSTEAIEHNKRVRECQTANGEF